MARNLQNSSDMAEYEDYIIRMKDLGGEGQEPKKKVSRLRNFLGSSLRKPLVVNFSRDAKSSFTTFSGYKRPLQKKDGE